MLKPTTKLMCEIFGKPLWLIDDDDYFEQEGLEKALMSALEDVKRCSKDKPIFCKRVIPIVRFRFGFDNPEGKGETLEQVGQRFGVTGARIRQVEVNILRCLRHPSRTEILKKFFKPVTNL